MEYCDVYNKSGDKTGKVAVRGAWHRKDGEYLLSVHILIKNSKGEYLIQKRSDLKKSLPGIWNLTCGMVDAGEEEIDAIVREIKEELGIEVSPENAVYGGRSVMRALFADIWLVHADFDVEDCTLQKDEVAMIKWVSGDELVSTLFKSPCKTGEYKKIVESLINA